MTDQAPERETAGPLTDEERLRHELEKWATRSDPWTGPQSMTAEEGYNAAIEEVVGILNLHRLDAERAARAEPGRVEWVDWLEDQLAAVYAKGYTSRVSPPVIIAELCDDYLDRSGAMLGHVRDKAAALETHGDAERAARAPERERLLVELAAAIPGTCDWGGCDNNALLARHDPGKGWLPVCQWHAGSAGAAELAPITAVAFEELWEQAARAEPGLACQVDVWDGPYKMKCGRSIVDGECGRHGKVLATLETVRAARAEPQPPADDWWHYPDADAVRAARAPEGGEEPGKVSGDECWRCGGPCRHGKRAAIDVDHLRCGQCGDDLLPEHIEGHLLSEGRTMSAK